MNLDEDLMLTFDILLKQVKDAGAVDAAVCGGAVRDMLLGAPISDIDILYVGDLVLPEFEDDHGAYHAPEFTKTHEMEIDGYKVDLIKCNCIETVVRTAFNSNIAKVIYDGDLGMSRAFMEAVTTKTIVFNEPGSCAYSEKILAKYPHYAVVFDTTATEANMCLDF